MNKILNIKERIMKDDVTEKPKDIKNMSLDELYNKFLEVLKENDMKLTDLASSKNDKMLEYKDIKVLCCVDATNLKTLTSDLIKSSIKLPTDFDEIKSDLKNDSWGGFDNLTDRQIDDLAKAIQKSSLNVKNIAKEIFLTMIQREQLVVNFYGSPGAGKSTMAKKFQKYLNDELGHKTTYVGEAATDIIQKKQEHLLINQPYVSYKQAEKLTNAFATMSKVLIGDSPLDFGNVYNKDENIAERLAKFISRIISQYTEAPVFIKHDENSLANYSEDGRVHSKDESLQIQDDLIEKFSDKDFIVVSRDISMPELYEKISEYYANKFSIDFAEALTQMSEIKHYEGIFPESFKDLIPIYELLEGKRINNSDIWENAVDFLKENVDFEDKDERDMQEALSKVYQTAYAKVFFDNLEDRIATVLGSEALLHCKFEIKDLSQGMFYFNSQSIYDINDFKEALISSYYDLKPSEHTLNEALKDFSAYKDYGQEYLGNGDYINSRVETQRNITEFLATNFGVFLEQPKYVPEPTSKYEQDLADNIKL